MSFFDDVAADIGLDATTRYLPSRPWQPQPSVRPPGLYRSLCDGTDVDLLHHRLTYLETLMSAAFDILAAQVANLEQFGENTFVPVMQQVTDAVTQASAPQVVQGPQGPSEEELQDLANRASVAISRMASALQPVQAQLQQLQQQ